MLMDGLTAIQLKELNLSYKWLIPLNECFLKYNINTPERIAGFVGQCQHESLNFTVLQENLNYSAVGLTRTWPSRFNAELATLYARNPGMIASSVYADRMGNGDEASGEGWIYRGRGLIQLTGKQMYVLCGFALEVDLVQEPDLLLQEKYAVLSAGWYWWNNDLNRFCDKQDWRGLTRAINGGYNGLDDRLKKIDKVLVILQG